MAIGHPGIPFYARGNLGGPGHSPKRAKIDVFSRLSGVWFFFAETARGNGNKLNNLLLLANTSHVVPNLR